MRFAELCIDEIQAVNSGRDAALRRADSTICDMLDARLLPRRKFRDT